MHWAIKKESLVVFNLADFCNSPNHQNKFYAKVFILYGMPKTTLEGNNLKDEGTGNLQIIRHLRSLFRLLLLKNLMKLANGITCSQNRDLQYNIICIFIFRYFDPYSSFFYNYLEVTTLVTSWNIDS